MSKNINNTPNTPRNFNLNRTYGLLWAWEGNYFNNPPSIGFSGQKVLAAYNKIPMVIRNCTELRKQFRAYLEQLIRISGRTVRSTKLRDDFCSELVELAQRSAAGCKESRRSINDHMAMYISLSLDEIAANEVELSEEMEDPSMLDYLRSRDAFLWINDKNDDQLNCA